MTQPGYAFIVGLPRTGTTLVRNILNCSEDVAICRGESHFFGDIRLLGLQTRPGFRQQFAKVGNISTDAGVKKLVDHIYNIRQNVFWSWVRENVNREDFLRRLLESDRTDRALFDLVMAFYADDKPVRGEKTPAHIHYVPTLLEWFPNAKIIHMFRDPRAVYVSAKKKAARKNPTPPRSILRRSGVIEEIYSSLVVITTCLRVIRLHHQYQQLYPNNYYFCKYEDLISDPKTNLQKLCDFLEIDFSKAMLQQTVVNSSFVSRDDQVQGFDTSAITRWRKHLHPVMNYWFVLCCKKQLLEFGYQL
jgi:hypothetical protein